MSRFILLVILTVFPLSFGKAQTNDQNKQLLLKAERNLIIAPDKTEKITSYLLKDASGEKFSEEVYNLKLKSLYYQGKYNEIMDLEINKSSENKTEDLIFVNIFRSLLIDESFIEPVQISSLQNINRKISLEQAKIQEDSISIVNNNFGSILNSISAENKFYVRENVYLLLKEILTKVKQGLLINGIQTIGRFADLYKDDPMFCLLYIEGLIYSSNNIEADIHWKKILEQNIVQSSNLQLKLQYYETLVCYSFAKNDVDGFQHAKVELEKLQKLLGENEIKARSYYFYLSQDNSRQHIRKLNLTGNFAIVGLLFLGIIFSVALLYRLHQIHSQKREYEVFLDRINQSVKKKSDSKGISEKTESALLSKLELFENTEYCISSNISLQSLAKKLGTNTKYLSEIINNHREKNFNGYINELRIQYILKKLRDEPIYRTYKIKYLAEESGFATHSQFATVFKLVSGMSPANYIKLLNKR